MTTHNLEKDIAGRKGITRLLLPSCDAALCHRRTHGWHHELLERQSVARRVKCRSCRRDGLEQAVKRYKTGLEQNLPRSALCRSALAGACRAMGPRPRWARRKGCIIPLVCNGNGQKKERSALLAACLASNRKLGGRKEGREGFFLLGESGFRLKVFAGRARHRLGLKSHVDCKVRGKILLARPPHPDGPGRLTTPCPRPRGGG